MANKIYNYDTPSDFQYDSGTIEVGGGKAKLKDLISVNETFYASYNTDINGDRGNGILTGTAYGGASVVGGKLDLTHNDKRYVTYDAVDNADSQQTGCIRFKLTPNYSGNPSSPQCFFAISHFSDYNVIQFYHWPDGTTYLLMNSNTGVRIMLGSMGVWNPTAGQEYEFELNYDVTNGATRIFIDGTQFGATQTGTGTRDSNIVRLRVGTSFNAAYNSNFKIDDFAVFDKVQHISNYTPSLYPEFNYSTLKPTIEPTDLFDPVTVTFWGSFLEILGGGNEGSIGYNLYKVDKANKYYWNGSVWTTGGSISNYNSQAIVTANIASFDATPDKIGYIAYLISNGMQVVELDENQITYTANQVPLVNAGSNKTVKDNTTIAPFSDCIFSDIDGTVDHVYYKVDGEVPTWVEIPQGAYGSLTESVQAFIYQFNNFGTITARLQVEDNDGANAEDSLEIEVQKYTKIVNIKDASTGLHLSHILCDLGDGTVPILKDSPFNYDWEHGNTTVLLEKVGYVIYEETILIENENAINLNMLPVSYTKVCRLAVEYKSASDKISGQCWLEIDGESILNPVECQITVFRAGGDDILFTMQSSAPTSYGIFYFIKTPSGLTQGNNYMCKIKIRANGNWHVTYQPFGEIVPSGVLTEQKIDSIKSTVESNDLMIRQILGLSQSNYRIVSPIYNSNRNLLTATIKTYNNKIDCNNDQNAIKTYDIVTTYDAQNQMLSYKVTEN